MTICNEPKSYFILIGTLWELSTSSESTTKTKSQSKSLLTNWLNFRSLLTATTLQQLLKSCDHVTKYLQTRELDLCQAVECIDFENNVLESERLKYDEIFKHGTHFREQVQQLVDDYDNADFDVVLEDHLPTEKVSRKRRCFYGEAATDTHFKLQTRRIREI